MRVNHDVQNEVTPEQLVRTHYAGIWRYLRLLGCMREQAEDLTQEAFLVAIRKGFEAPEPAAAAAYLRQTARYLWLQSLREQRVAREVDLEEAESAILEFGEDGGDAWISALRQCVEKLAGKAREAVLGIYKDQRPHNELAQSLGLAPNGLKTLLQRTRESPRDCVERRIGK